MAKITVEYLKEISLRYTSKKIDMQQFVELLNEKASERDPNQEKVKCEHLNTRHGHSPFVACICNDCNEEV